MITLFIVFVVLLLTSSFFSASETAITFASRPKLHQLAKAGNKSAKIIRDLQQHISMVVSAILAYNTLLNAAIASVGASLTFDFFGENSTIIAVAASIFAGTIVLVFAEMLPKTLAIQDTIRFLMFAAPGIRFFYNLFLPINKALSLFVTMLLKAFGFRVKPEDHNASVEELRGAIDMHDGPGQDTPHEKAMLKSILDLGTVQVSEIMVHRQNVTMINADDSPTEIVDQVLACPFTRLPLWQGNSDNIVGIINTKTLLRAVRAHSGSLDDLDIVDIAHKPWFTPESTDLLEQLHAFRKRREHFSLVVDEYGALMGIVTLEDLLEEIVGDIADEHDVNVRGVRPQPDGSFVIYGNVTMRDLNRQFDWELPDDAAATLAGLLITQFRVLPTVGQIFNWRGFRFEILRRQRNQITLVKVTPPVTLVSE
ncbi:MAG: CNNM domain-containing protein [Proteobacteria bacterium]|jgi:Mg2+/Co2+ transporter CorB|nr:CNNM domain-containing protein [Pseudomonadota bacterium]